MLTKSKPSRNTTVKHEYYEYVYETLIWKYDERQNGETIWSRWHCKKKAKPWNRSLAHTFIVWHYYKYLHNFIISSFKPTENLIYLIHWKPHTNRCKYTPIATVSVLVSVSSKPGFQDNHYHTLDKYTPSVHCVSLSCGVLTEISGKILFHIMSTYMAYQHCV
jgi:hypothetical protein